MTAQLLDIIEKIYDTALSQEQWSGVLNAIADISQAEAANLLISSPKQAKTTVVSPRTDPEFIRSYFLEWGDKDETLPATMTAPIGKVLTLADTGRESFLKSEFYNDYWRRSGHGAERMRSNLIMNSDLQVGFGMSPYAHRDEITPQMDDVYRALLPHLIRSVNIRWRLYRAELERAMRPDSDHTGTTIVNSDGRLLVADHTAETILNWRGPLFSSKGRLAAMTAQDTNAIHQMIQSCGPRQAGYRLRGGNAVIGYPGTRTVSISILPVPRDQSHFAFDVDNNAAPAAMVMLTDLTAQRDASIEKARSLYKLTRAESVVALETLNAGTRSAIAANLELSEATVRSHLSRIYPKVGVKGMADLVRKLFQDGFGSVRDSC